MISAGLRHLAIPLDASVIWWSSHGVPVGETAHGRGEQLPLSGGSTRFDGSFSSVVVLRATGELGLWCSLPAALSSHPIARRAPRLHLHVRPTSGGPKLLDTDIDALFVRASNEGRPGVPIQFRVTPTTAFAFVRSGYSNRFESYSCPRCPNTELVFPDSISVRSGHTCSNCGRETAATVTTLLPAQNSSEFEIPHRELDLDQLDGCTYTIWASTPALIWTAQRPQEIGIHVHVERGTDRIIDETFGSVWLHGKWLDRTKLIDAMINNSQV